MFMYLHCRSIIISIFEIFWIFLSYPTGVYLILSRVFCVCVELKVPCNWSYLCGWRSGPSTVPVMTSIPRPVVSLTELWTSVLTRVSQICVNGIVANVISTSSSLKNCNFFIKFFFMNIHWNNVTRKSMISLVLVDFSLVEFVIQPCKYVDTKNLVLYVVMLLCNTFMLAKYSQRRKLCRSSRKMSSIYM